MFMAFGNQIVFFLENNVPTFVERMVIILLKQVFQNYHNEVLNG
jgi:hypothetical protein